MINDLNADSILAAASGRRMFLVHDIDDYDADKVQSRTVAQKAELTGANLISSECEDGKHMPVIDFDFPARVVPSTTEGHGHLYIDEPITWEAYERILDALEFAGLVQPMWVKTAKRDKRSYVRLPHVSKRKPGKRVEGQVDDSSLWYAAQQDRDDAFPL